MDIVLINLEQHEYDLLVTDLSGQSGLELAINCLVSQQVGKRDFYCNLIQAAALQCIRKNNAHQLSLIFDAINKSPEIAALLPDVNPNKLLNSLLALKSDDELQGYFPENDSNSVHLYLLNQASYWEQHSDELIRFIQSIEAYGVYDGVAQIKARAHQVLLNVALHTDNVSALRHILYNSVDILSGEVEGMLGQPFFTYAYKHKHFGKLKLLLEVMDGSNFLKHADMLISGLREDPEDTTLRHCCFHLFKCRLEKVRTGDTLELTQIFKDYASVITVDEVLKLLEKHLLINEGLFDRGWALFVLKTALVFWSEQALDSQCLLYLYPQLSLDALKPFYVVMKSKLSEVYQSICSKFAEFDCDHEIKTLANTLFFSAKEDDEVTLKAQQERLLELFVLCAFDHLVDALIDKDKNPKSLEKAGREFFAKIEEHVHCSGLDYWQGDSLSHQFVVGLAANLFPNDSIADTLYHTSKKDWCDPYTGETKLADHYKLIVRSEDGLLHPISQVIEVAAARVKSNYTSLEHIWLGCDPRCGCVGNLPIPLTALEQFGSWSPAFKYLLEYTKTLSSYEYLNAFSRLRNGLLKGSANVEQGGEGEEQHAGKAADIAQAEFMHWWEGINPSIKATILGFKAGDKSVGRVFSRLDRAIDDDQKAKKDDEALTDTYCVELTGDALESLIAENYHSLLALSNQQVTEIKSDEQICVMAELAETELKQYVAGQMTLKSDQNSVDTYAFWGSNVAALHVDRRDKVSQLGLFGADHASSSNPQFVGQRQIHLDTTIFGRGKSITYNTCITREDVLTEQNIRSEINHALQAKRYSSSSLSDAEVKSLALGVVHALINVTTTIHTVEDIKALREQLLPLRKDIFKVKGVAGRLSSWKAYVGGANKRVSRSWYKLEEGLVNCIIHEINKATSANFDNVVHKLKQPAFDFLRGEDCRQILVLDVDSIKPKQGSVALHWWRVSRAMNAKAVQLGRASANSPGGGVYSQGVHQVTFGANNRQDTRLESAHPRPDHR